MFYALVLLSGIAFVAHLVLLDRLQRFRIVPLSWRNWWSRHTGVPDSPPHPYYHPENYSPEGRSMLNWVYLTAIVWLLFVGLAAAVLRAPGR